MSIEANKQTARRASELYTYTASPEVIDSLFAPELLVHYPHRTLDFAAVKASFTRPAREFTEARTVVEDIIAEGDRVVTRERLEAVHGGTLRTPLGELPPTGKPVDISRIVIRRFRDGKIAEVWVVSDQLGLLQQVGAIPTPDQ